MNRDLDEIIKILKVRFPNLRVVQMDKVHPADDDGLWWFRLPGGQKDIQIESPDGTCPFLIESDDDKSPKDARTGHTIEEVVEIVGNYLSGLDVKQ
jgi:hypothetical protein